ncbi:MAG: Uma2 family endonuclease [Cyanobacteria bacterium RM1_2_2]|nr:Uma2 family endonuclease [Cyanobacteria bacterium RM1_2_2]
MRIDDSTLLHAEVPHVRFATAPGSPTPPLEDGNRLTRAEVERRYHALPNVKKAELIEGIVHMASPPPFKPHAELHGDLMTWLGTYKIFTPGVRLGDNPTVRLDSDNEPQPNAVLLIDPRAGGRSSFSNDGYVEGAPELVAEIAANSAASDLRNKKQVYHRNGVQEYLVWQVFEQKLDWFILQAEDYRLLTADPNGIIRSSVFPGLWLAVSDLLRGNTQKVLAVLRDGLSSAEHQRFVQKLANQISSN